VINIFESGYGPWSGGGPYFGNPDGQDGYAQPGWFKANVPNDEVAAFVHSVPETQAAIDRAFQVAKANGVGNLSLTQHTHADGYTWAAPPSPSFMRKFFANLRA
jgi:hypothetical protein